jgi:hypothetical protein
MFNWIPALRSAAKLGVSVGTASASATGVLRVELRLIFRPTVLATAADTASVGWAEPRAGGRVRSQKLVTSRGFTGLRRGDRVRAR